MTVDLTYIENKFAAYNALIFGGQLPVPRFRLCRVKTYLGKCAYQRRKPFFGKEEFYNFELRFNCRMDLPAEEWDDIIIHEMIHYYIGFNHLRDRSAHGPVFCKLMKGINAKYGRHITISHKLSPEQRLALADQRPKPHVVAVVSFRHGSGGIKVLPCEAAKVKQYYKKVLSSPKVDSVRLYRTSNPFFNQYPTSMAYNAYRIEPALLAQQLADAEEVLLG